ncbi:MAG TPA: alkaline phosphatase family protein [Acidimicrobiales bacterium]|jgi:phospholipase C|nr:alkaline phosphatase family protein [Acidimicrobiales bacterium]
MTDGISRRSFLGAGITLGGAAALSRAAGLTASQGRLIDKAVALSSGSGSLSDIQHIVILMQENRSFDHYFGTMPGVRGFTDPASYQSYAGGPATTAAQSTSQSMVAGSTVLYRLADGETVLQPFELFSTPPDDDGQATNDITHDWGPQHLSWNSGAMDSFARQHLQYDGTAELLQGLSLSSVPVGVLTMGYFRSSDYLAYYRAVADAFTICDGYFCSVLGPTDPNRLMWMSGSVGATGVDANGQPNGGPILETYTTTRLQKYGTLTWKTMPEVLTDHGVGWKVYQDPTGSALFNVLNYFKTFNKPANPTQLANTVNGLVSNYPLQFAADVAANALPKVTWIIPPLANCEHPATAPAWGEYLVSQILQILVSNPGVWERTAFIVTYDENGGWYDHVAPPAPGPLVTLTNGGVPPTGLEYAGEYVTPAALQSVYPASSPGDSEGVLGPVGLGFRVPALVISPFSAGGWVCSDTFDHVSTLKLIEKVFLPPGTLQGAGGLDISPWRYQTVGDLTAALPTLAAPVPQVPPLPATSMIDPGVVEQELLNSVLGTEDKGLAYPPPAANHGVPQPDADSTTRKPTPS